MYRAPLTPEGVYLGQLTTEDVRRICAKPPTAILLPVGSVEPHGPHLPLATDTIISEESSARAARVLGERGIVTYIAPSVPYGVTDFAEGFSGAISVPSALLRDLLRHIVLRFHADGWTHVCLVNNHLEPAHDAAVRGALDSLSKGSASVACPLTRRWARTLSDEFKRGDCHAGRYETSLALAAGADVRAEYKALPGIAVSLADGLKAGKKTFQDMGLSRAYTGAPMDATAEEGHKLYDLLAEMIVTEVTEGIASRTP